MPDVKVDHWFSGNCRFVEVNTETGPPGVPPVALNTMLLPEVLMLLKLGGGAAPTTLMVPLTYKLAVFQDWPAPRVGSVTELNVPTKLVALNRVKVSPPCSAPPILVTMSAPLLVMDA